MAPPSPSSYPVPSPTPSFWHTKPHPLTNNRSTPALPQECDILIIGAGFAGAAIAYHLLHPPAEQEKEKGGAATGKPSVVILEARGACGGATGRNGGHLRPDILTTLLTATAPPSPSSAAAAEVLAFETANLHAVAELVERDSIACDFQRVRTWDVFLDEGQGEDVRRGYDALKGEGEGRGWMGGVEFVGGEEARAQTRVRSAAAALASPAASLHPPKLVAHLLSRALARGANLQTHTPVATITPDPDAAVGSEGPEAWLVTAAGGRGVVKAGKVVFAANAWTADVAGEYRGVITPVKGVVCRIEGPRRKTAGAAAAAAAAGDNAGDDDEVHRPELADTYCIHRPGGSFEYLIPLPRSSGGGVIVGGAKHTYEADRAAWYDVADDDALIGPAAEFFRDGYMQRTFLGWGEAGEVEGEGGARVEELWSGIMAYTADGQPHVGAVPGKVGQFVLAGFNGHGMPVVFLAAKGVAEMVRDGSRFGETGVPGVFETSEERLRT